MKLKNKILILIVMIFTMCMMIMPNNVHAALQANGSTSKTDTIGNWLLNIRQMEATGGTLGLTDTINTTSLVSSATTSNNLDIHMEKNTEYGAMAILSASAYGNQNVIANGETTTGNKTGVYMTFNNEWTAAGGENYIDAFTNANSKYKNVYPTRESNKYVFRSGDAIEETSGWHGGTAIWLDSSNAFLLRAYSGSSIFSYYGHADSWAGGTPAYYTRAWSTRAVIVIGNGF